MTTRNLPKIEALATDVVIDWEPPAETARHWSPVRAAVGNDDRSLNIFGRIGEDPFSETGGVTDRLVSAALRRMGAGPVTVNINSRGGDFFTGVNIYNQLHEHDGEVTVRVLGLAASAASVVAFASDRLLIGKAAFMMIHNSHGIVIGSKADMTKAAKLFDQFDGAMASVYAERSGNDRGKVVRWMDAETFFSGDDAVKNGLADGLLASDEIENEDEPAAAAALRRLDIELAQKGMPRAERRALLSAAYKGGTPGAAANAMPGAGADDVVAMVRSVVSKINA